MLNQTLQYDEKTIFPYKQSYYVQKKILILGKCKQQYNLRP